MNNPTLKQLQIQIHDLQLKLAKQEKISNALLERVKKDLKYQLNTRETFEHNNILLNQIKNTKNKLTQEADASQRFSYLARHDSLTGLYNRTKFNDTLKQCVETAKKNHSVHALFFLDLDQFKVINDTAGHLAGDEMLRLISTVLLATIKEDELLARLGGDEFGLIKQNCTQEQALQKANQILSLIDEIHFTWDDKLFSVSASIGLIMVNNDTSTHIEAQKNVDIACYAAKNAGRNRVHLYHPEDDAFLQQSQELQWIPKLTNALENDLFCLYAQVIKPTNPEINYLNYEILVRLKEGNKIILPTVFLPPAERYNLMTKIDSWIIEKTFSWLSQNINKFHPDNHFSINLSGQSLGNDYILKKITSLLKEGVIQGSKIQFEVTETMAISNFQIANQFINTIKQFGCGFSLDDFGSGLSSLSYLKNLDVDALKVDGIFIRDIIDDPIDEEMVRSINKIGHVMGIKTIAEYVENDEIAKKLIDMGFDYLQGNSIGLPIPLNETLLTL